ncbi:unnamed protein product [Leuciscus chuanchicus]
MEKPQGHVPEGEEEGDGEEECVSSRVCEEVEILSDLGIPQPHGRRVRQIIREMIIQDPLEQALMELLVQPPAQPPAPPPQSANEHFLLSLLPFLQSMPPNNKENVKFQI